MLAEDAQAIMGNITEAQGHLQSEGQRDYNDKLQRAHKSLMSGLTTTGPMDRFDHVSEDAKKEASDVFYERASQNPGMDPTALRLEVEKIFKPVVEKRREMGMSEADKTALTDARMQIAVQKGALSRAAYKEWKDQTETWRNIYKQAIEAQKTPPPQPSLMERAKEFGSSFFNSAEDE